MKLEEVATAHEEKRFTDALHHYKELLEITEPKRSDIDSFSYLSGRFEVREACKPLCSLLSEEDFSNCSKEEIIEHSRLAIAIIDELLTRADGDNFFIIFVKNIIEVAWENENELRRLGQGRFASEEEQAEAYLKKARGVFDRCPHMIDNGNRTESILFFIRHLGNYSRKREELGRLVEEVEEAMNEKRQRGEYVRPININALNAARKELADTCKPLRSLLSEEDFLKCSKEEIIEHSRLAIATIDELLAKAGNTLDAYDVKEIIEIEWNNENELQRLGQGRFSSEDEQAEAYLKKARETFSHFFHMIDNERRTGAILFYIRHLGNNSRKQEELQRLIQEVEKARDEKRQRGEKVYSNGYLNQARKELAHTYKPLRSLLSEEDFSKCSKEEIIEHSRLAIATIDELLAKAGNTLHAYDVKEIIEIEWNNENELQRLGQGRFASEDEQAEAYLKKARETFSHFFHMIDNERRTAPILFPISYLGSNSRKEEELRRLIEDIEKEMDAKRKCGYWFDDENKEKLDEAKKDSKSLLESKLHTITGIRDSPLNDP